LLTRLTQSSPYFFFVAFFLTAFLVPHFFPHAIIITSPLRIPFVVGDTSPKSTTVTTALSDILQGRLSIQHILPYLFDKCSCIGKFFFSTQMPYKRDLHFLAVESLVKLKKVYFY